MTQGKKKTDKTLKYVRIEFLLHMGVDCVILYTFLNFKVSYDNKSWNARKCVHDLEVVKTVNNLSKCGRLTA